MKNKIKFRKGSWIILPSIILSFFISEPAKAESYTVTGAQDFSFTIESQQLFTVRAYAAQYGIDSHLWLYNSQNQQIAANDDYFGLDSYISRTLSPGVYRLRAGVCCGDPNIWYGNSYRIETNFAVVGGAELTTTTSSTTTTTTEPPTTTTTIPLPENANWSMVNEGSQFELVAPEGFVFSEILFASYGTPNGSFGHWEIGNCHAQNSLEIISNVAIGNQSFSISATNNIFGDPCGGTPKRLAVTALYAPAPTTTSTTTTTTIPRTTTTQESTTTTEIPTTTESPTTTEMSIPDTTVLETTTSTQPDIPETIDSTTSSVVDTTTAQEPTTTLPPTTTTSSSTTSTTIVKVPTITTSSIVTTTTLILPTTTTVFEPEVTTTTIENKNIEQLNSLTSQPLTSESISEVINILKSEDIPKEQVVAAVDAIIEQGITEEIATEIATNPEIINNITSEQAKEIFQEINVNELTEDQKASLTETLTNAPSDIKDAFENEIDIFGDGFDDYVPNGSKVDVKTRRAVIAATAVVTTIAAAPMPSGGAPSAPSGGSPSGGSPSGEPSSSKDEGSSKKNRKARRFRRK